MTKSLDRLAVAASHRSQHVHRGLGTELEKSFQVLAIESKRLGLLNGHDRRAARAVIQHREFAEKITAGGNFEHDPLASVVLKEHFHLAGANDVNRIAGIAIIKNRGAALKRDDVELRGELGALVFIKQLE